LLFVARADIVCGGGDAATKAAKRIWQKARSPPAHPGRGRERQHNKRAERHGGEKMVILVKEIKQRHLVLLKVF